MGLVADIIGVIFGSGRNILRETAEVFVENAETGAKRANEVRGQTMAQFSAEFATPRKGGFDHFMDGLNRLPRPALALGTLALFISAMVDPLWFGARMQGLALVPEPLWWLLGVIVSFYFGARHQRKAQDFQRDIAQSMGRVPQVVDNIAKLREMRPDNRDKTDSPDSPGAAESREDASLTMATVHPEKNRALEDWKALRVA